jgi:hypothetical protein
MGVFPSNFVNKETEFVFTARIDFNVEPEIAVFKPRHGMGILIPSIETSYNCDRIGFGCSFPTKPECNQTL